MPCNSPVKSVFPALESISIHLAHELCVFQWVLNQYLESQGCTTEQNRYFVYLTKNTHSQIVSVAMMVLGKGWHFVYRLTRITTCSTVLMIKYIYCLFDNLYLQLLEIRHPPNGQEKAIRANLQGHKINSYCPRAEEACVRTIHIIQILRASP